MDIAQRIFRFNADRDPEILHRKYALLAADPFRFLRGTCHLFYADWHGGRALDAAPGAWICGDMHLENFGSYRGDNRLAYFDLNDFDEAALAPCTWEIARVLTSLHVAAPALGLKLREARALTRVFLDAYATALGAGKVLWIERATARGPIGDLLDAVAQRRLKDFLDAHTVREGSSRRLQHDGERLLPLAKHARHALLAWCAAFAAKQSDAKFFRPLDVARRVAGTGSVGIERYAILVRGSSSPNRNALLDMKRATPSAAATRLAKEQPAWRDDAMRIVAVQLIAQAVPPAFLEPARFERRDFVVRELQPMQDRLDLARIGRSPRKFEETLSTMARLAAWSALRGSGRHGSATADQLIAFAHEHAWRKTLIEYVETCSRKTVADWRTFRNAWRDLDAARKNPTSRGRARS